jgi:chemosensory pili system protein ChpA (sensor histidine kinase/response regulator)
MDSAHGKPASDTPTDLSALAWVQDELRRSLDAAHKALRRFVKEQDAVGSSDVDVVDPSVLRSARNQLHQGAGALELVGLPEAATLLRASEAAVQRYVGKPHKLTSLAVDDIERASFGLLDYIGRLLAGKSVWPLSLFPQYRAVQEVAGAERVHPADLWHADWRWRELPADSRVGPISPDAAARGLFEAQLLRTMRGGDPQHTAAGMSDLCAGLGAAAAQPRVATLWRLAAAMFEGQALGLLGFDVYSKRVASRLMSQFKALERGDAEVSERLAQDLLFFCAQCRSPGDGRNAPRLAAVRAGYALAHHVPVDYSRSVLGRYDPAWVLQARKRVNAAKESWSAVAGGEAHRISGLAEQFALVGDSLRRLFPLGESFAGALQQAAAQTQQGGAAPPAPLAMEVATSLLYIEAALEDAEFDHPEQAERVQRLAARIDAARKGQPPAALEPWMEELYRRVSERQTMGSVVQELRTALSEAEKLIDQFFRNPLDRRVLIPVPNQLSAMRGVLSVLGMEQASAALLRMRDGVDGLASTVVEPERVVQAGVFHRLADNLGALGFLIDMLSVQPVLAKSLFVWDADGGTLSPVMGRGAAPAPAAPGPVEPRLIEQAQQLAADAADTAVPVEQVARELDRLSHEAEAADQRGLAATVEHAQRSLEAAHDDDSLASARGQLSARLNDFVVSATEPIGLDELPAAPAAPAPAAQQAELSEDDEMRGIFLEEAREVIADATAARAQLLEMPGDVALLTSVRRGFHTLKGSSRMVGLKDFGEAAWVCEQIYNTQLADQRAADPKLLDFTGFALEYLREWVEEIAARGAVGHASAAMKAAAERLGAGQAPPQAPAPAPAVAPLPPGLPSAADLELAPAARAADRVPELSFDLDLGSLDEPAAAVAPAVRLGTAPARPAKPFDPDATVPLPLIELPRPEDLPEAVELIELPLPLPETTYVEALAQEPPAVQAAAHAVAGDDEAVKVVGPLRIAIPLFNIYLTEADELSRRLTTEVAEWAMELHRPVGEGAIALAHSLAGSSATVGFGDLSHLARGLEHALMRAHAIGHGTTEEGRLFVDVAEEIRRLLHQFAAGFLKQPDRALLARLAEHELSSARRLDAAAADGGLALADARSGAALTPPLEFDQPLPTIETAPAAGVPVVEQPLPGTTFAPRTDFGPTSTFAPRSDFGPPSSFGAGDSRFDPLGLTELRPFDALPVEGARTVAAADDRIDSDEDIDAVDSVDPELFPIFEEEGQELLPHLASSLRDWARRPTDSAPATACMRTLHTLKGGARLAGAMRLGEMAHRLETRIEHLLAHPPATAADVESLHARSDTLSPRDARAYAEASVAAARVAEAPPPAPAVADVAAAHAAPEPAAAPVEPAPAAGGVSGWVPMDWSRFAAAGAAKRPAVDRVQAAAQAAVRVRVPLLDRLVNHAGEVSITRSRIEASVDTLRTSLTDLTENLDRLRQQLRDIELQAETQMSSRMEAAKAAAQAFDPLEFDRFTRFQELTRMMAESVNDVATVQRTLHRALDAAEDELAAQARLTRDMQDDLLRTRMVEFEGLSDRLYRVVRLAAKETGKQVRLDIVGGSIEVDRGVLDRMTPAFEHLLRNCVAHGIESPQVRTAAAKDPVGAIVVAVTHEGNEVGVEFRDDGAGLDLRRIRERGVAMGLLPPDHAASDQELTNLIFTAGFSTAESVTELAGRGIGMDVVRNEINAMGGRIETATAAGQGTSFKLILPLTTAVTQVVMLRVGAVTVAVPSTLVEIVRRASAQELEQSYASGSYTFGERTMPFFWLGALLQTSAAPGEALGRMRAVLVVRSAQRRVAIHVDEVLGNQEVVVKNLGPQLSRLPGLAGMTLLASGAVALIYNPVALATLFGEAARAATQAARSAPPPQPQQPGLATSAEPLAPLVLVVDDSLTVRRVTQRLLTREGYRVVLAKDGLEALERLADERPQVVLSDIEMPRMDGFDLVRNIRADQRLADLPVIMITSRIAQKHRDVATQLGVDHYLGKPYSEEDLLALIGRYTSAHASA